MRFTFKDSKRLDFLGRRGGMPFEFCPQTSGGIYLFGYWADQLGGNSGQGVFFKSLRLAIDAAMRKHEKMKKEKP